MYLLLEFPVPGNDSPVIFEKHWKVDNPSHLQQLSQERVEFIGAVIGGPQNSVRVIDVGLSYVNRLHALAVAVDNPGTGSLKKKFFGLAGSSTGPVVQWTSGLNPSHTLNKRLSTFKNFLAFEELMALVTVGHAMLAQAHSLMDPFAGGEVPEATLQQAATLCAKAAGIYDWCSHNCPEALLSDVPIQFFPEPSHSVLAALSAYALLCAQQISYEIVKGKAEINKTLKAKLAFMCTELSVKAKGKLQVPSVTEIVKIHLTIVESLYRGLGFFHLAQHHLSEERMGAAVCFAGAAAHWAGSAEMSVAAFPVPSVRQLVQKEVERIRTTYAELKKDNDSVYLEPVPDIKSFPPVYGMQSEARTVTWGEGRGEAPPTQRE
uniref:BRO1 domain-containing protein n=1 Tax=Chromera velia CCMP2878 TaxID=1169474 RepID=A0A0G4FRH9_9ALVE|eukprot:Cvel_18395.t1-p1 / transcript=Cvel_18395.t1 / gene=Cvel_18395 / organism=Chromera_velia_CCMP2878 / gene_product=hypothetical protein / transcript_product=hypothetical protein / location=Cvel_scaffold1520:36497-39972(+) / protein_length=376 / sequence_SO=supercontig / SO=protein_coding / is_pseudo=false